MLLPQIALVSQTPRVLPQDLMRLAAALQKQVTRDLAPIWKVNASVSAFGSPAEIPPGYWPVFIRDDTGYPGAAGIHLDDHGQPFALVDADENLSLTTSHELLEMLVDPYGNRLVAADSVKPGQGRVHYLLEVCDPSEAGAFGYRVNGLLLSDFYTPQFFAPVASPAVRYSFTGAIPGPRQILRGGYLSWLEPITGQWWQADHFGNAPRIRPIQVRRTGSDSWRQAVDAQSFTSRRPTSGVRRPAARGGRPLPNAQAAASPVGSRPDQDAASLAWATGWERCIERVLRASRPE